MVGLPSMAQISHFWPWYGPTLRAWCMEPLCPILLFLFNMHVCAYLDCTYMFHLLHLKPVSNHDINFRDLVLSTPFFMCSKFDMISLRYHGAGSQVKASFVRTR